MALTLTRYAGNLATQLVILRRSVKVGSAGSSGQGQGSETGVQRIGPLTSNAGNSHLCYYDPDTDTIFYDDGYPRLSPEKGSGE